MASSGIKPNKKQKAIIQLLNIIEKEGLCYGVTGYGIDKQLKVIKDERLIKLAITFIETTNELEEILGELKEEVEPFLEDD
jgi:hypothetical protein